MLLEQTSTVRVAVGLTRIIRERPKNPLELRV